MEFGKKKKFDKSKSEGGVDFQICLYNETWHEYKKDDPIAEFVGIKDVATITLARLDNKNYTRFVQEQMLFLGGRKSKGIERDTIINKGLAKHVIKGWSNFETNGKSVKFTEEQAMTWLKSDVEFREFVIDKANERSRFYEETLKVAGKN